MLMLRRVFAGLVGLLLFVNGVFMLFSSRAWFQLPYYLRATGTMTEKKFASGWGVVQTRIAGGVMVGGRLWVIYDMFLARA
jgi:hypothetical protein